MISSVLMRLEDIFGKMGFCVIFSSKSVEKN